MSDSMPGVAPEVRGRWIVYRLDDNGNTFIVQENLSREEAEALVALFQARGHKQLYWAQEE
jgi:hypothetical protein